jgi:cytidylate kinase
MRTHRDPTTLLQALNNCLATTRGVVAIDGVDGSGKSTLANTLSQMTGWAVLRLDDYLQRDQSTYVQHIDLKRLRTDLCAVPGIVLVEGVCVLRVLERIDEPLQSHIYVKRLGRFGNWLDEVESCFDCNSEQKIAELSEQVALVAEHRRLLDGESNINSTLQVGLTEFRAEVIRYHSELRPFERAAYIYERIDCDV